MAIFNYGKDTSCEISETQLRKMLSLKTYFHLEIKMYKCSLSRDKVEWARNAQTVLHLPLGLASDRGTHTWGGVTRTKSQPSTTWLEEKQQVELVVPGDEPPWMRHAFILGVSYRPSEITAGVCLEGYTMGYAWGKRLLQLGTSLHWVSKLPAHAPRARAPSREDGHRLSVQPIWLITPTHLHHGPSCRSKSTLFRMAHELRLRAAPVSFSNHLPCTPSFEALMIRRCRASSSLSSGSSPTEKIPLTSDHLGITSSWSLP